MKRTDPAARSLMLMTAALAVLPGCGQPTASQGESGRRVPHPSPPVQPAVDYRKMASYPLPPTRSASHQVTGWNNGARLTRISATEPPVSFAFDTGKEGHLYTREVNLFTCRAENGPVEWVGTHMGIKAVDRSVGEVRHYTSADGLPGDYVEAIAADEKGVYCVVRIDDIGKGEALTGERRVALCTLDPVAGRWKTLQSVDYSWAWSAPNKERAHSYLALTEDTLAFVPTAMPLFGKPALYLLDRHSEKVRTLPVTGITPGRDRQNSYGRIPWTAPTFLACVDDRAYIGCSEGVLSASLKDGTGSWRHLLKDSVVDAGSVSEADKGLWLICHDRQAAGRYTPPGVMPSQSLAWTLARLDTATGQATPASSSQTLYYPIGVAPGPDGGIWATWYGATGYNGIRVGGFERYDPQTRAWRSLDLGGRRSEPAATNRTGFGMSGSGPNSPATPRAVPDVAALPLALTLLTGDPNLDARTMGQPYPGRWMQPFQWASGRFQEWVCADDAPAGGADPHRAAAGSVQNANVPDPSGSGMVWAANGDVLYHLSKEAAVNLRTTSATPSGEQYPFQGGTTLVRPDVQALLVTPGGLVIQSRSGVYQLSRPASAGGSASNDWKTLYTADTNGGGLDAFNNRILVGGPDKRLYLGRWGVNAPLYFDPAAGRMVNSPATLDASQRGAGCVGATDDALWYYAQKVSKATGTSVIGQDYVLYRVPIAGGGAEDIALSLPGAAAPGQAGPAISQPIGMTGNIVWFPRQLRKPLGGNSYTLTGQGVIGYDVARRVWTPEVGMNPRNSSSTAPVLGPDGGIYAVGYDNYSVYSYDPASNQWKGLVPAVPPPPAVNGIRYYGMEAETHLLAVGDSEIWLADSRRLIRFDRKTRLWANYPLPETMQGMLTSPYGLSRAALDGDSLWVGSDSGLYRFKPATHSWTEVEVPVNLPTSNARVASSNSNRNGVRLDVEAVDDKSVWGVFHPPANESSSLFRFDRATHRFTLYDRSAGVSDPQQMRLLVGDGDALWSVGNGGTYRLNPKVGKMVPIFASGLGRPGVAPPSGVPSADILAVKPDPANPDVVYLLASGLSNSPTQFRQYPVGHPSYTLLYRYRKSTGHLESMPASGSLASAIGTGGLWADKSGDLWVGTSAGVCRVNRQTGAWSLAAMPKGVDPFAAYAIRRNDSGALLVYGEQSILKIDASPVAPPMETAKR